MCEYCKIKTAKTGWKYRGARLAEKYPDDNERKFNLWMQPTIVDQSVDGTKRIMLYVVEYDNTVKLNGQHLEVEIFYCPFCGEKFD